jgi:hypothetical protein
MSNLFKCLLEDILLTQTVSSYFYDYAPLIRALLTFNDTKFLRKNCLPNLIKNVHTVTRVIVLLTETVRVRRAMAASTSVQSPGQAPAQY